VRRILGTAVALVVMLAVGGVAAAATSGTYAGTSTVTISGFKASHPFSLTVKSGRVAKVKLILGATCATLNGSAGINVKLPINKHGHFSGSTKSGEFTLNLQGAFKGKAVTGSFSGSFKGASEGCSAPKNTFKAHR
jgi:type 1 fimbria pilin